jgi:hypothetical protein
MCMLPRDPIALAVRVGSLAFDCVDACSPVEAESAILLVEWQLCGGSGEVLSPYTATAATSLTFRPPSGSLAHGSSVGVSLRVSNVVGLVAVFHATAVVDTVPPQCENLVASPVTTGALLQGSKLLTPVRGVTSTAVSTSVACTDVGDGIAQVEWFIGCAATLVLSHVSLQLPYFVVPFCCRLSACLCLCWRVARFSRCDCAVPSHRFALAVR